LTLHGQTGSSAAAADVLSWILNWLVLQWGMLCCAVLRCWCAIITIVDIAAAAAAAATDRLPPGCWPWEVLVLLLVWQPTVTTS
jgi:hypothetical protein